MKVLSSLFLHIITFFHYFLLSAQPNLQQISDSIINEGFELYRLEKARENAAVLIKNKLSIENVFGLISYIENNAIITLVLSGNEKKPSIKFKLSYDESFADPTTNINKNTLPTSFEKTLIKIRNKITKISSNKNGFITADPRVNLNMVFLWRGNKILVYLIPYDNNPVVISFGNDYLFTFNTKGKLLSKQKLHNNLIEVEAKLKIKEEEVVSSFHTHGSQSSPYITPSDICILLMNKGQVEWGSHLTLSPLYLSFFDLATHALSITKRTEK
ncbi:MAG: hypothetical protein COC01_01420 [Bacteroidetes bacterium]|nr:MAG: hypothetical protein COC01_01420 [Bacteroidota bacterium]